MKYESGQLRGLELRGNISWGEKKYYFTLDYLKRPKLTEVVRVEKNSVGS